MKNKFLVPSIIIAVALIICSFFMYSGATKVTNELSQMRIQEMSNKNRITFPVDLYGGDSLYVNVSGYLDIGGTIGTY